ncbi:AMP-binding protein [bacterium]|nr:AMP-binding protein [bacterium]
MTTGMTIRSLMEESITAHRDLPAISFCDTTPLTFGNLEENIHRLAADLLSRSVQKGDAVAILSDNCPNWVIAYLAAAYIGAVAVPILTGFPDSDIRHILRNADVKALFISDKLRGKLDDFESDALGVVYRIEDFSAEYRSARMADVYKKLRDPAGRKKKSAPSPAEILSAAPVPVPEDLAAIIYTSGTTGSSKGVMLTNRNIASDVVNALKKFPLTTDDRFLSILPLAHTFEATGGMLCPLAAGVSIYYMEGLPTPQKLLAAMSRVRPTGVLTVPLVVDKIYRKRVLPKIQSSRLLSLLYRLPAVRKTINGKAGEKMIESFGGQLRFFMFGGAALNPDVETFIRDARISYSTGYGMTETAPILTINPFGRVKAGSCGQAIPEVTISIDSPDPATGIGEIIVRGPNVMQGYYKNPEATKEIMDDDGWLHTGDLGYLDKEGYLFIKGRSKNVIIGPSGENIFPEIIEQLLLQNEYIQQAIVFKKGHALTAKVYPDYDVIDEQYGRRDLNENEASALIATILEQVRVQTNEKLAVFSQLSKMEEYPEPFEMTPTNKVKRYLYI